MRAGSKASEEINPLVSTYSSSRKQELASVQRETEKNSINQDRYMATERYVLYEDKHVQ